MGSETKKCERGEAVVAPAGCAKCGWEWTDVECERCALLDRDRKAADYDRLAARVERLTRERDEVRAQADLLREIVQAFWRFAGVADAAEGEPWKVNETNGRLWQMRHDLTAAEARAEALATTLREVVGFVVDCRRDIALTHSDGIIGDAIERAEAALDATPPADLTQHPAYRAGVEAGKCPHVEWGAPDAGGRRAGQGCWLVAGHEESGVPHYTMAGEHPAYRAGLEAAAKVCDDWRTIYDAEQPVVGSWAVGVGAELCAGGIRALLDTKEVRDGG